MHVVAVSGSLRKRSYNTALLRAAQKLAPEMGIEILDISMLPIYNQDLEDAAYPETAKTLRENIRAADGVLLAVPEFNRTPAAPMKNFLDWSSRPEDEPLPWELKPVGIIGASSGLRGANLAQFDVRRVMSYFNARTMGQPEFYCSESSKKFDDDLNLSDEKTTQVLRKFLTAFTSHVEREQKASR
ncbi:MAG TPA: NADPH-dependent FMN reductase [Candidatus Paceibacterota bacterium]|nr:NADPH-dependent FMN reductase [Candidatus Paceibacterota bacterium]